MLGYGYPLKCIQMSLDVVPYHALRGLADHTD